MNLEMGRNHLRNYSSFTRMPTLIYIADYMSVVDWLTLLGEQWECCDNISENIGDLQETPFSILVDEPLDMRKYMMTEKESTALNKLPEIVTVYRGCYENNKRSLCWTLDQSVAEKFPSDHRYKQNGQPLLLKADIRRDLILAVKLGRSEDEIIAIHPKIRSIRHLPAV